MENLKRHKRSVNHKRKACNEHSKSIQKISVRSKKLKCGLNSWNFRKFQFMLDYKHKLNGFAVEYLNPRRTSSLCSRRGGKIAPMEKNCPIRGFDRDVNACINLLKMLGGSGSPESLSMSVMKLSCQGLKADEVDRAKLRGKVERFSTGKKFYLRAMNLQQPVIIYKQIMQR